MWKSSISVKMKLVHLNKLDTVHIEIKFLILKGYEDLDLSYLDRHQIIYTTITLLVIMAHSGANNSDNDLINIVIMCFRICQRKYTLFQDLNLHCGEELSCDTAFVIMSETNA